MADPEHLAILKQGVAAWNAWKSRESEKGNCERPDLVGAYLIVFVFDKPATRDLTETISTLAHMARFVIADITDPRSVSQELMAIVPHLCSVPIQPLLLESRDEYDMFQDFKAY